MKAYIVYKKYINNYEQQMQKIRHGGANISIDVDMSKAHVYSSAKQAEEKRKSMQETLKDLGFDTQWNATVLEINVEE